MRFNYHERDEDDFAAWSLVHLLASSTEEDELLFKILEKKTNGWRDVELTIRINDVPVDTENFLNALRNNMEHWTSEKAEQKAHEVLDDVREKINDIDDLLEEVASGLRHKINSLLKEPRD